jgi:hypothetical protein
MSILCWGRGRQDDAESWGQRRFLEPLDQGKAEPNRMGLSRKLSRTCAQRCLPAPSCIIVIIVAFVVISLHRQPKERERRIVLLEHDGFLKQVAAARDAPL